MTELKPCPKCGGQNLFAPPAEKFGALYVCCVGCKNLDCEQGLIIKYGLSAESARKRAAKAWNRRANNG
jgi:hypothetical protein